MLSVGAISLHVGEQMQHLDCVRSGCQALDTASSEAAMVLQSLHAYGVRCFFSLLDFGIECSADHSRALNSISSEASGRAVVKEESGEATRAMLLSYEHNVFRTDARAISVVDAPQKPKFDRHQRRDDFFRVLYNDIPILEI